MAGGYKIPKHGGSPKQRNAGGLSCSVAGGTIKDSSYRAPSVKASRGVNSGKSGIGKGYAGPSSRHGGYGGKTPMKMGRQGIR